MNCFLKLFLTYYTYYSLEIQIKMNISVIYIIWHVYGLLEYVNIRIILKKENKNVSSPPWNRQNE